MDTYKDRLPLILSCPICTGTAELSEKLFDYENEEYVFSGIQLFYRCNNCAEEFTTTQSDNITFSELVERWRKDA